MKKVLKAIFLIWLIGGIFSGLFFGLRYGCASCADMDLEGEYEYSKTENGIKHSEYLYFMDDNVYFWIIEEESSTGVIRRECKKGIYEAYQQENYGNSVLLFADADGNNPQAFKFWFEYTGSQNDRDIRLFIPDGPEVVFHKR